MLYSFVTQRDENLFVFIKYLFSLLRKVCLLPIFFHWIVCFFLILGVYVCVDANIHVSMFCILFQLDVLKSLSFYDFAFYFC